MVPPGNIHVPSTQMTSLCGICSLLQSRQIPGHSGATALDGELGVRGMEGISSSSNEAKLWDSEEVSELSCQTFFVGVKAISNAMAFFTVSRSQIEGHVRLANVYVISKREKVVEKRINGRPRVSRRS
jgi:hypothetical protein